MDLQKYVGVYRQDSDNTFVFRIENNNLILQESQGTFSGLQDLGDDIFQVIGTETKIHFLPQGKNFFNTIQVNLPDRQFLAKRVTSPLFEKSPLKKRLMELMLALVIFTGLVAATWTSYPLFKQSCYSGSYYACRMAAFIAYKKEDKAEAQKIVNKGLAIRFTENEKELKSECEAGDKQMCLLVADQYRGIRDFSKAMELYRPLCKQRISRACNAMATINFEQGQLEKAKEIHIKACNVDIWQSCLEIASNSNFYVNPQTTEELYKKVCRLEGSHGCFELASIHQNRGDFKRAQKFYEMACKKQIKSSCQLADVLQQYGDQKIKCDNKDASSCFQLAGFEELLGKRQMANLRYNKACELGHQTSCSIMEKREKIKSLKLKKAKQEL